jgi:ribosome-binding factor A
MAGLVPAIHAFLVEGSKTWMPGTRPGMTICNSIGFVMSRSKKPKRESAAPGGSQRQLRVGELVRHAVAEMLTRGDVHDPVIEGHLITVPEVRMSPDLRLATVYVMPMGGRDAEQVVAAFDRHKKYMRTEIAHRVNLKFAPDIRFRVDDRFAEAERIEKLLRSPEVKRDLDHGDDE